MKIFRLILISVLLIGFNFSASAMSLDEAKSKGFVGEQANGYLGIVSNPDPEVQALVADVNRQRKTKYVEISNKNGTTMAAVEALAGEKAIQQTPKGRFVQSNGNWQKK
jgi:uncharacterized protein